MARLNVLISVRRLSYGVLFMPVLEIGVSGSPLRNIGITPHFILLSVVLHLRFYMVIHPVILASQIRWTVLFLIWQVG